MRRLLNERSAIGVQVATVMAVVASSILWSACASAPANAGQETVTAETPEPAAAGMTILDGVYTEEQAGRGENLAQANCWACHSSSEWSNGRYVGLWAGRSVGTLFDDLERTMPYDEPGRLTREEYSDLIAYIFSLSDVPAGDVPLPSDADGLAQIQVVPPGS